METPSLPDENEFSEQNTRKIAELNDSLRRTFTGGQVLMTRGVQAMGEATVAAALARMRAYDTFTPDNDPYGEHDFGSFDENGRKLFWKIDYYDLTLQYGSPAPYNPELTKRVLTLMLAEEY